MKRLWIAVSILTAVAWLCAAVQLAHSRRIETAVAALDRLEEACVSGDKETALALADRLAADFTAYSRRMACFLPHGAIEESRKSILLLPVIISRQDSPLEEQSLEEDLAAEIVCARLSLARLQELNRPTLSNIL